MDGYVIRKAKVNSQNLDTLCSLKESVSTCKDNEISAREDFNPINKNDKNIVTDISKIL